MKKWPWVLLLFLGFVLGLYCLRGAIFFSWASDPHFDTDTESYVLFAKIWLGLALGAFSLAILALHKIHKINLQRAQFTGPVSLFPIQVLHLVADSFQSALKRAGFKRGKHVSFSENPESQCVHFEGGDICLQFLWDSVEKEYFLDWADPKSPGDSFEWKTLNQREYGGHHPSRQEAELLVSDFLETLEDFLSQRMR